MAKSKQRRKLNILVLGAPVLVTVLNSVITGNVEKNCQVEGGAAAVLTLLAGNTIDDGSCGIP